MLHLTDAPSGDSRPAAAPGTRRLLVAYCPASLRAALTADLVRRAAERQRLVVALAAHPCASPELPDLMRFNIHPPNAAWPLDGPPDITVAGPRDAPGGTSEGATERPAERPTEGSAEHTADTTARIHLVVGDDPAPSPDADPLALRLALLARHRDAPPPPDPAEAAVLLAELRGDVARSAESPSAAMPASRIADIHDAIDTDLDIPRALALIDDLRDAPEVAAGARFEALIHLDRTLGLDLAQDIGRVT